MAALALKAGKWLANTHGDGRDGKGNDKDEAAEVTQNDVKEQKQIPTQKLGPSDAMRS